MYKAYAYICIDTSDKASIVYWVILALPIHRGGPLYIGSRLHVGDHARRLECACVIPGTRRTCAKGDHRLLKINRLTLD